MFTGIIEEIGTVRQVTGGAAGQLTIAAQTVLEGTRVGDSIAVNGVCLTVTRLDGRAFTVDVMPQTLRQSNLGQLHVGSAVNLERAVPPAGRLGGHLVQGHVDGVGTVIEVAPEGDGRRAAIEVPGPLTRYVAEKGSLTVDGVSLTVAAARGTRCEIAYIPHTLAVTIAGAYAPGRRVNLEVDLVARYLARLLEERGVLEDRP